MKIQTRKKFRRVWKVPSKLHGWDDGRASPRRNLSCPRQHLCHRHAGYFHETDHLGIIFVINFSKNDKTTFQRPFPGQPGRHWLLVLPDCIHLRRSLSGETDTFHFETPQDIFTRPQVAYCAVQTTQFFTFYAGTAGGPQLRFAEISEVSAPMLYQSN